MQPIHELNFIMDYALAWQIPVFLRREILKRILSIWEMPNCCDMENRSEKLQRIVRTFIR